MHNQSVMFYKALFLFLGFLAVLIFAGVFIEKKMNETRPTYSVDCVHGNTVKQWSDGRSELLVNFWTTSPIPCTKDE